MSAERAPLPPVALTVGLTSAALVLELGAGVGLRWYGASSRQVLLFGLVSAALMGGFIGLMMQRVAPVHRAAGRLPPSPAALRDLYRTPAGLAALQFASRLAAAAALLAWGGVDPVAAPLFLMGFGAAGMVLFHGVATWALRSWLVGFAPQALAVTAPASLGTVLQVWLASAVWLGGSLFGLTWLGWLGPDAVRAALPFSWLPWAAVLLGGAIAGLFGRRLGAQLDADLARLANHVRDLGHRWDGTAQQWPTFPPVPRPLDRLSVLLHQQAQGALASASQEDSAARSIRDFQTQKMMFMASTGHDLRAPLNAILGFSELLLEDAATFTEAQRESLRAIVRSGEELLQLLQDILESARIATGRLTLERSWVPAVEILTDAVEQAHRYFGRDKLRIETSLQPGLPPVHVDRARLLQAIGCLLRHAGRGLDGGVVALKAYVVDVVADGSESRGSELRVEVIDASESLAPEDRERIFVAFQEISLPSGRRLGGLGLSLSLARSLVVAHGGTVSASDLHSGGTSLTIAIPLHAEPEPGNLGSVVGPEHDCRP